LTRILAELAGGNKDPAVRDRLYRAAYAELRRLAGGLMRRERANHTLSPTALVHEAYLKLVDQSEAGWESRAHFLGIAARAMRQILVDHARRRAARKRGGRYDRVTLEENLIGRDERPLDILILDAALEKLAAQDARAERVVELRIFTGLTNRECALVLGVSLRTVEADWKLARMWLGRELAERSGA